MILFLNELLIFYSDILSPPPYWDMLFIPNYKAVAGHTCMKMRQSSRRTFNQPFFSRAITFFPGQLAHFLVYIL